MQDKVLSIDISLAMKWSALPENLSIPALRQNNKLAFSLLEVFNESSSVTHEPHYPSPELQRIENKLNLLIDMVSQLSGQRQQYLHSTPVKLSCKGIEWISDTAIEEGELLLELCLDGEMQHTLKIIAGSVAVKEQAEGYLIHAAFSSLDEIEENHLEKWIFSHHRRTVAQRRSRKSVS